MGGICRTKYKERGAWFEIKCVKNDIISKEAKGVDASFERKLLRAWAKVPGYESAQDELGSLKKSKSEGLKGGKGLQHTGAIL